MITQKTFSPVTKIVLVKTLLVVASVKHMTTYQMDVNNTFLHGDIIEEIFMAPSPGMLPKEDTRFCHLKNHSMASNKPTKNGIKKLTHTLMAFGFT